MQVPWLIDLARELGAAKHIGPGTNRWSNVHIDDLVDLYLLALDKGTGRRILLCRERRKLNA